MQLNLVIDTDRIISPDLDDRGRITIPKDLRDKLGLEPGDSVEVAVEPED